MVQGAHLFPKHSVLGCGGTDVTAAESAAASVGSSWETAALPQADRYPAWQGKLNDVYGAWDVSPAIKPDFDAEITGRVAGRFQIVDCTCDPCGGRRSRAEIRRDPREQVTLQLVLAGREHVTIDDKRIALAPGDVLVWTSLKPMSFEVVERLRKLSVTLPLERLRNWLPRSWHSIETDLPRASPGAALLSSVIRSLSAPFLAGGLRNGDALTESVIGVLVNVLGVDRIAEPATLRAAHLIAVKAYIDAHLTDADLSPARISGASRISLRYLHRLFEDEGITLQQYVIRERLLRCRRELANRSMASRTITDIAFSSGFQNAGHFSRRFKAAFGMSPNDYRMIASAAQS